MTEVAEVADGCCIHARTNPRLARILTVQLASEMMAGANRLSVKRVSVKRFCVRPKNSDGGFSKGKGALTTTPDRLCALAMPTA